MPSGWMIKEKGKAAILEEFELDELKEGEVLLDVHYSSINYKDALALCGRPGVIRSFPLVAGIDIAGEVVQTRHPNFSKGMHVFTTGYGLGEEKNGGLATKQIVLGDNLMVVPQQLSTKQVMQVGTAGFTAALCLQNILDMKITPADGPLYVTGANGGVGTFAVALAAEAGFEVTAISRNPDGDNLKRKGATHVLSLQEFGTEDKPLAKASIAAAIDSVGGDVLSTLLARMKPFGAAAICGLAKSPKLDTTVIPFILRNVRLLGVSAVYQPVDSRLKAWDMIASFDLSKLEEDFTEIPLSKAQQKAEDILAGKHQGRYIVKI